MTAGERAWLALGCGVVSYNLAAEDGQMFSEVVDEWLLEHPWLTRGVVVLVALHLLNALPSRADPVSLLFAARRLLR